MSDCGGLVDVAVADSSDFHPAGVSLDDGLFFLPNLGLEDIEGVFVVLDNHDFIEHFADVHFYFVVLVVVDEEVFFLLGEGDGGEFADEGAVEEDEDFYLRGLGLFQEGFDAVAADCLHIF